MSLRRRLMLACAAAVALAVVLAAGLTYWFVRDTLRDQIDVSLRDARPFAMKLPPADELTALTREGAGDADRAEGPDQVIVAAGRARSRSPRSSSPTAPSRSPPARSHRRCSTKAMWRRWPRACASRSSPTWSGTAIACASTRCRCRRAARCRSHARSTRSTARSARCGSGWPSSCCSASGRRWRSRGSRPAPRSGPSPSSPTPPSTSPARATSRAGSSARATTSCPGSRGRSTRCSRRSRSRSGRSDGSWRTRRTSCAPRSRRSAPTWRCWGSADSAPTTTRGCAPT